MSRSILTELANAQIKMLNKQLQQRKADIESGKLIDLARYHFDKEYAAKVGPLNINYDMPKPSATPKGSAFVID